jgi:lactoylglutathione lyase
MKYTHTTLHIKDLEKSLAFYHDLLGLPIVRRFPAGKGEIAFVGDAGSAQIELIPGAPPASGYSGFSIGLTVDSLDAATEKLAKAGYPRKQGPISPNPAIAFSFFEDPDGVCVQLLENR